MLIQQTYDIPTQYLPGLASGQLVLWGSDIRNTAGRLVKQLRPVDAAPPAAEDVVARALRMAKDPRVIIGTIVVGTVAAGAAAGVRAWKGRHRDVPEVVANLNASLAAYLDAVRVGALDADIITTLLADLDAVTNPDDDSVSFEVSAEQAQMLVGVVRGSLTQLAEQNDLSLAVLDEAEPAGDTSNVVSLRRYLEAQRDVFRNAG